jgi:hypothetical protein
MRNSAVVALALCFFLSAHSFPAQTEDTKENRKQVERLRKQQEKEELSRPLMVEIAAPAERIKPLIIGRMIQNSPGYLLQQETPSQLIFERPLTSSEEFFVGLGILGRNAGTENPVKRVRLTFLPISGGTQIFVSMEFSIQLANGSVHRSPVVNEKKQRVEISEVLAQCKEQIRLAATKP